MIRGEQAVATLAEALHHYYPVRPGPRLWTVPATSSAGAQQITFTRITLHPQPEVHPMWQKLAVLTPPEPVRAWFYRVSTVAGPLLIAYGTVEDTRWPLWLALIQTALGFGMAGANSSTKA